MVAIVTRAGKGSPLTNAEVDSNFTNLNNGKVENTQAGILAALGYTPVNKAGDTISGALSLQGDVGSSTSLVIYNTASTDGRAVAEFRNDRNSVQRYLLGIDPDGGSNKAFALRDVTGGAIRLWVTAQGNLNVGGTHVNNSAINVNKLATGSSTLNGFGTEQAVQSDVSTFRGYNTAISTQAASFTLGSLIHYRASQGTLGAGSTVTSQNGFVADASLIGAGTNIGFRGAIPSGANRWNLFMDGTAQNFLGGATILNAALGFGASGSPSYGTSGQLLKSGGSGAAPSWGSLTSGEVTTALGFTPYNSTNPSAYIDTNGTARTIVENNGTVVGTRRALNFIPGTGISLSIADDSANEEVDITITSTVTAPVQSVFGRTGNVTLTSSDVTTALGFTPLSNGGGTLTGALTLQSSAPILNFFETDQTLPAGRRRLVLDGNSFSLRRNTAAAGDFSTEVNDLIVDSSSNFTAAGNVTAYSDERLKVDWCDLPTDFVERLAQIKHGKYTRIDTGDRQVGASAQQWQALLPEAVMTASDDLKTLSLAYGNVAVVSAIQLAQRVVSLTARVHALEQKMGA